MKTAVIALITAISLTACSTIVSDSKYNVNIKSAPVGANFTITTKGGVQVSKGVTPETINLKASAGFFQGETYNIEFNKAGYAPKSITLDSGIDGWYFGNILIGGWLGLLIIDPLTGAMFTLPKQTSVTMLESSNALTIQDINELSNEQRELLVKL